MRKMVCIRKYSVDLLLILLERLKRRILCRDTACCVRNNTSANLLSRSKQRHYEGKEKLRINRIFTLISLCLLTFSAYGYSWQDLWKTQDQQAAEALQHGKAQEAISEFQNPAWRATALYRNQQYAEAAKSFKDLNSSLGYYNEGNALAHMQQYQEAIAAYDKSLALDPNNEDAKHNKAVLEKLSQQSPPPQQQNKDNQQDKQQQKNAENNASSNKASSQNQQNKQDSSQANNNAENNNNTTDNNSKSPSQANNQKQNTADENEQQEQEKNAAGENKEQQATASQGQSKEKEQANIAAGNTNDTSQQEEQMLQQLSDNPGGLLQQKFLRDSQRYAQGEQD